MHIILALLTVSALIGIFFLVIMVYLGLPFWGVCLPIILIIYSLCNFFELLVEYIAYKCHERAKNEGISNIQ